MQEYKQSVKQEIQSQEGSESKNKATLEQHSHQQSKSNQAKTFELSQMHKCLQEIQATQSNKNGQAPYLQTQPSTSQPSQTYLENRNVYQQKQSPNHFRDNNQHFMRGRGRNHGHHRGHHHFHHHHMMNNHKDFHQNQSQPENQAGFSDEYWHQYHDRQRDYILPPPHHSEHHFNPWNIREGNNKIYPIHSPPSPPYLYQQQQYPAYHPLPQHCYQNPYPYHYQNYTYQNEAYQPHNYQGYQHDNRVRQQKEQSLNYPQKKNFKCQYKKRQRNWGGQQGCDRKMKGRKHSKARSRSSSSSSDESREKYVNEKTKMYVSQITQYYTSQLQNLFQTKSINTMQRQKILKLLIKKFPRYEAPFQKIFESIAYLQTQNLLHHMPYIKVIKVLLKLKLDMVEVVPRISCIQAKKIKKYESDLKYMQLYGGQEVQPPLEHGQLIDMDQSQIIYMIDGNNVLPTHKNFRNLFQSTEKYKKLEAQLRFQWLVSFALEPQNVFLFFDQKYEQEDIKIVSSIIFPNNKQSERANKIKIIYGDKKIADDKIVEKFTQIQKTQKPVILVSADRELHMRCKKIANIKHTGGRFFFKFLKYVGVHRKQNEKYIKKLIKTVIRPN